MESSWSDPEFVNAPDVANKSSKFMKHKDIPEGSNMILKYTERHQKEMTPELRQKMEAAGATVGDIYWVYYFTDSTDGTPVTKEYSAFKKMTALTIAMKGGQTLVDGVLKNLPTIEKGDTFSIRRIGSGYDTRFEIVKLTGDLAVNQAMVEKATIDLVANPSGAIPF